MNHILMVTFVLVLSATVWGKVISDVTDAVDYPRYAFNYAIRDPLTRDNKAQWEERDGDRVNGAYSLLEPDGNLRVVEYSADDFDGFNAIVRNLASNVRTASLVKPVPYPVPPINPLIDPLSYGFGGSPLVEDRPRVKVTGNSLPWDSRTGSYGGWVPINGATRQIPFATIYNKKYVNGHLHKIVYGPIPIPNKSIILIKKKHLDD